MKILLGFFLLFAVFFTGVGRAAMEKNHWEVLVSPGMSLPGGNNNDLENESLSLEASIERVFRRDLSLGLEVGEDFGHKMNGTLFADVDNDGIVEPLKAESEKSARVYRFGSFIKWGTTRDWGTWGVRWVRRFFILGAGLYHYELDNGTFQLTGTSSTGKNWPGEAYPFSSQNSLHFGMNVGVGFEVEVFDRGIVGFDLRFHQFFRKPSDGQYWIPSLKFGYIF